MRQRIRKLVNPIYPKKGPMSDNIPMKSLRSQIAKAILDALKPRYGGPQHNNPDGLPLTATADQIRLYRAQRFIEAVMAVLSTSTVLRVAANILDHRATGIDAFSESDCGEEGQKVQKLAHIANELRRVADEIGREGTR